MKLRYMTLAVLVFVCAVMASSQTGYVGVISSGPCCAFSGTKGEPFSADVISETNQVLADGNRIHQEQHGRIFRDSQGRSRNEMEFPQVTTLAGLTPRQHIFINDPVQQVTIILDPQEKTARVHHHGRSAVRPPDTAVRTSPAQRPPVQVMRETSKPEKLGTMDIEGFTATGTRLTHTIPAGQMGNEQPIVTVHESWISQELHEVLLSKSVDPRSGEHTRKLVNIQRVEPDPALFQIPPDYTVKDDGQQ